MYFEARVESRTTKKSVWKSEKKKERIEKIFKRDSSGCLSIHLFVILIGRMKSLRLPLPTVWLENRVRRKKCLRGDE